MKAERIFCWPSTSFASASANCTLFALDWDAEPADLDLLLESERFLELLFLEIDLERFLFVEGDLDRFLSFEAFK